MSPYYRRHRNPTDYAFIVASAALLVALLVLTW